MDRYIWGPIREPATSQPHESSRIMSTTESFHLSLDNANGEIQRLEAENRRLREAHPERVAKAELSTEVQRLKELYEQALGHPQERQAGRREQTFS